MKTLFSTLTFVFASIFAIAQESEESETSEIPKTTHKYFISTNSGLYNTPVGFRIGVLDRMGGYIATRFGKGNKYEEDRLGQLKVTETTLFAGNAGLIFPLSIQNTFKVHMYVGIGYGKWFDRLSKSGQTMGVDFESGFMLSYQRFMVSFGGNLLTGDGNSPRKDLTLGVGFKF